jgi:hypothetical protein
LTGIREIFAKAPNTAICARDIGCRGFDHSNQVRRSSFAGNAKGGLRRKAISWSNDRRGGNLSQVEPPKHAVGIATSSGRVRDDGEPQAAIVGDSPVIVERPLLAEQRPTLNWRTGPLLIGPRRAEVDPMKRPNALASAPGRSRGPAAIQTTMTVLIWSIGVSKNHAAGGANPERVSSRGQLNAPQFSIAQRCYL